MLFYIPHRSIPGVYTIAICFNMFAHTFRKVFICIFIVYFVVIYRELSVRFVYSIYVYFMRFVYSFVYFKFSVLCVFVNCIFWYLFCYYFIFVGCLRCLPALDFVFDFGDCIMFLYIFVFILFLIFYILPSFIYPFYIGKQDLLYKYAI